MPKDRDELAAKAEELLRSVPGPEGPIAEAFVFFNEQYKNLVRSGFTKTESLWLIGYCMFGSPVEMRNDDGDS